MRKIGSGDRECGSLKSRRKDDEHTGIAKDGRKGQPDGECGCFDDAKINEIRDIRRRRSV